MEGIGLRLARGVRAEAVGDDVLVLGGDERTVARATGDAAVVLRAAMAGAEVPLGLGDLAAQLAADGIVEAGGDPTLGSGQRRRFLAGAGATAAGLAVLALPTAAAAASGGGGAGGGGGGGGGGGQTPAAPTISASAGVGSATIDIVQPDNGAGPVTNYEYSLDDGATWVAFSPAVTSGPVTIPGLSGPTTIRLRAIGANGASAPSGPITVDPVVAPGAPVITAATPGTLSTATLAFTEPSGSVTGYEATVDGGGSWLPVVTSSGSAVVSGITSGSTIRLRAVNSAGPGTASNAVSATLATQTFTANGTFTVPAGVTTVGLVVIGGAGGSGGKGTPSNNPGGQGGQPRRLAGTFTAAPGSTRTVIVGQGGGSGVRGTGDAGGGAGGTTDIYFGGPLGGTGGGGGGATSVKGSGLDARAGGGGGGGGGAGTTGNGGAARTVTGWSPTTGGFADSCESGGGGGGGGGGGCGGATTDAWSGPAGTSGFNANTPGQGGGMGGWLATGLTGASASIASGRTIAASGRSQDGEATFTWLSLTVA